MNLAELSVVALSIAVLVFLVLNIAFLIIKLVTFIFGDNVFSAILSVSIMVGLIVLIVGVMLP